MGIPGTSTSTVPRTDPSAAGGWKRKTCAIVTDWPTNLLSEPGTGSFILSLVASSSIATVCSMAPAWRATSAMNSSLRISATTAEGGAAYWWV